MRESPLSVCMVKVLWSNKRAREVKPESATGYTFSQLYVSLTLSEQGQAAVRSVPPAPMDN